MTDISDLAVFWAVVAARFFVPFAIPKYPLPGVLASLIIDGIDQTIFQQYTNLPLDKYQGYDKALDIYYLTVTYLSTFRIWTNLFAFQLNRFLFFYRLSGVTLFELIQLRPLLMIFPNTFEYFFIFYEIVRLKWNPGRLSRLHLVGAAALIWIFIKLPQEYIIHIAQVDMTDWFGENVALLSSPWTIGVLVVLVGFLLLATLWLTRRLPATDWSLTFSADATLASTTKESQVRDIGIQSERFISMALVEKIVLVSMVGIIFAQVLPDMRATGIEITVGAAILILISTSLSQWLVRSEFGWAATIAVMIVVNFGLILVIAVLLPTFEGSINLVNLIFFTILFTVVVTMLDRFRQAHLRRFATGS